MPILPRLETGIPELDDVLSGGLPTGSVTVLAGEPGAGKTVFALQTLFHQAARGLKALYVTTLSEPAIKLHRYLPTFAFYDEQLMGDRVLFGELGSTLHEHGLSAGLVRLSELVEREQPDLIVIDSFKALNDLAPTTAAARLAAYELSVELASWGRDHVAGRRVHD